MTRIEDNKLIIEVEEPQQCDYCGKIDELRPYGRNGTAICYECGMKPENKEETDKQFMKRIEGVKSAVYIIGE